MPIEKVYMYAVIRMGFSSCGLFYVCPVEEAAVSAAVDLAHLEKDDYHSFYVIKMPCGEVLDIQDPAGYRWPKYDAIMRIYRKGRRVYTTKTIDRERW